MPFDVPDTTVFEIDQIDIAFKPWSWPFAAARRAEVDRHFAEVQRRRPAVWNGRVMLLNRFAIDGGVLRGGCFEADYASFLAWREWDFPDPDVVNVFAAAALRSADGAYLIGEMAPYTAAAGQLYFPAGTPEPADVNDRGLLDLQSNLERELLEETGLDIGELVCEPGWTVVPERGYLPLLKRMTVPLRADELRSRIMRHLANDAEPELTGMHIVRGPADLDPRMSSFVVTFLEAVWRQ